MFEVRIDKWLGHNQHNVNYSNECLEWADIIFCEWGLGNAVWYSKNKKSNQKLIVRIHSQELRTNYYKHYEVNNIDKFICVGKYMYYEINKIMNIPIDKINVIFNYVDYQCLNKEKLEDSEYHLGILGICPKSKRLDLAIDIFEKLWRIDNRYKLFIKGKNPNEYSWLLDKTDERIYYKNIYEKIEKSEWKGNIYFEEYSMDIENWFTKIGFILSTSDFESFHLAVGEGMASGSIPIILNWKGAEYIYPSEYIFKDIGKAIEFINNKNYDIDNIKKYSKEKFNYEEIFIKIKDLINI